MQIIVVAAEAKGRERNMSEYGKEPRFDSLQGLAAGYFRGVVRSQLLFAAVRAHVHLSAALT
jgi:hypothetical protein